MVEVFYAAATLAVLLVGGGVFWAAYHVVLTLQDVRQKVLPNVDLTLTEVQKNLNRIDTLSQDLDTTVGEANQLVSSANRTVQKVENGLDGFSQKVAIPTLIAVASAKEGLKAAWHAYRASRAARPAPAVQVRAEPVEAPEPTRLEAPTA